MLERYLALLGPRPVACATLDELWDELERRHGPAVVARLEDELEAAERTSDQAAKHRALNASLDLALDFELGCSGELYRGFLAWLERAWPDWRTARRIVDLGCGDGLLTCFCAWACPEAEVVGVDRLEVAVRNARELAQRLGLANVRFGRADLVDAAAVLGSDVDLALACRSLLEALAVDAVADLDAPRLDRALARLAAALAPGGRLVSLERLLDPVAVRGWVAALERAGLAVDPAGVELLELRECEQRQRMPALLARRPATIV